MIASYFKISFEHMKHKKLRSWLTVLGIVIGIMAIISLVTLGEGFENAVVGQFEQLGGNTIRIVPENLHGPPVGTSGLTIKDVEVVEGVTGVDFVTPYYINFAEVAFKNEDFSQMVVGFEPDVLGMALEAQGTDLEEGRVFKKGESNVAVVGYSIAKEYYDSEMRARNSIYIEGEKYKIVGIQEKQGISMSDQVLYIPMDDAREMFGDEERVNTIVAYISDSLNADNIADDIQKKLERSRNDDDFEVFPASQILEQLGSILQIISIVLSGIATISLVVGGVGIMNSMYTSVIERTREIGTMKSIGAKGSEIFTLFLIEAGMVGAVGGVLGTAFGVGVAYAVQFAGEMMGMSYLDIRIRVPIILFAVGFSFTVGVISGTLPAYRASKLNPVEALRYE